MPINHCLLSLLCTKLQIQKIMFSTNNLKDYGSSTRPREILTELLIKGTFLVFPLLLSKHIGNTLSVQ